MAEEKCPDCGGSGDGADWRDYRNGGDQFPVPECRRCGGTGKINTETISASPIMQRHVLIEMIDEEIRDFPFESVSGKIFIVDAERFEAEKHPVLLKLWQMINDIDETLRNLQEKVPADISKSLPELLDEFNSLPEECSDVDILTLRSMIFKIRFKIYLGEEENDWGKIKEKIKVT